MAARDLGGSSGVRLATAPGRELTRELALFSKGQEDAGFYRKRQQ
jgi:hypothetical protein